MENLGDEDVLKKALGGDQEAQAELIKRLTPMIQYRVGCLLWAVATSPDPRSLVEDLTQEIFLHLFRDNAKILRAWDPKLGSLKSYVGMIVDRRGRSMLRRRQREWPSEDEKLERPSPDADPEAQAASREQLEVALERLRKELSSESWQIFELLFVDERSTEEVCQITELSPGLIYQRKSRLLKKARELREELQ